MQGAPVEVRVDQHRRPLGAARRRDAQHDIGEVAVRVCERAAGEHEVHRAAHLLAVHLRSNVNLARVPCNASKDLCCTMQARLGVMQCKHSVLAHIVPFSLTVRCLACMHKLMNRLLCIPWACPYRQFGGNPPIPQSLSSG